LIHIDCPAIDPARQETHCVAKNLAKSAQMPQQTPKKPPEMRQKAKLLDKNAAKYDGFLYQRLKNAQCGKRYQEFYQFPGDKMKMFDSQAVSWAQSNVAFVQKITKKWMSGASVGALSSLALAGLAVPDAVNAQTTAAGQSKTIDEVVVIGTRRTDRTLTTSASPIDVISATELKTQPSANMIDIVKNIVPSFFVGQNTISDASSFTRAPSLRGLPGDEILVMLNGKRYNRAALVQVYTGGDTGLSFGSQGSDISAIPAIAIKNLQVLRDGATAQYGSDAIAGVLNYGLKDSPSGLEVNVRYGQNFQNGDGASQQYSANLGLPIGTKGFINLSGEYDDDAQTSRGATRPLAVLFAQQNPTLASQLPNYPDPAQIWGSSPSHGYKLLLNAGYDITAKTQVYAFGNYAETHGNESFNFRSAISGSFVDSTGVTHNLGANGAFTNTFYLTPCPTGSATCPAGGFVKDTNTFQFKSLYPAGFTPRFLGVATEEYGTVGLKGEIGSGLTYDLSGSISENSLDLSMTNSLNASYGPQTQTSFKFGQLIQKEQDLNLDLSYPLAVSGLPNPVTISGGAEWRKETYTQTAGDPQSYGVGPYAVAQNLYSLVSPGVYAPAGTTNALSPGASGYGGTSPNAAGTWSQTGYGIYTDIETDLTQALSVGVAGRYENYNTFGDTEVGKFNAIYKFTDAFSLRGTIGTGFHAPSPGQSNDEILTTNFVGGNQVQTGTYPVSSPISKYYGATTLGPEQSTNYGIGFVSKPLKNTTVTVDGYQIDVTNRIGISQNFTVTAADVKAQPALISVGVGGNVNYFTNGFDTSTKGVDIVATHRADIGASALLLTLAYNYNKSSVTKFDPKVISAAQIVDVAHLAPNHRLNLSANWSLGNWTVNGRTNYYGSWRDEVDYPGQKFGAKATVDLDVSYTFMDHYTVTAGAQNIFNTFPDKIAASASNPIYPITGSTADGQIYPRSGGPFGINGGLWYMRFKFDY
jgi:iron complex outermembrane receptor protein